MFLQKPCFVCFHHTGPVHDCVLLIGRWSQQLCTPTHPWAAIETGLVSRTFVRNCPFCMTSRQNDHHKEYSSFHHFNALGNIKDLCLIPYTSNWSKCFMLNWISQKPRMFSERWYVYLSNWDIFSRITPTQEQLWEFEFTQERGASRRHSAEAKSQNSWVERVMSPPNSKI